MDVPMFQGLGMYGSEDAANDRRYAIWDVIPSIGDRAVESQLLHQTKLQQATHSGFSARPINAPTASLGATPS